MNDDATQTGADEVTEIQPAWQGRSDAMERIAAAQQAKQAGEFAELDGETGQVVEPEKPRTTEVVVDGQSVAATDTDVSAVANTPTLTAITPKLRTIVVDGQRIEVDEAKIIEQGIRTLQKESAADKRLAEANRLLQRARSGYVEQEVRAETEPTSQPNYPDPRALMETVGNLVRGEIQATRAVDTFKAEFPEIASDPFLMRLAIDREDQRLAHALSVGDDTPATADVFRAHGQAIRDWLKQKGVQTSTQPALSADKLERKRTTTVVQAANVRAAAPQANRPQTVQEQIDAIRQARKGRPLPSASRSF